MTPEDGPKGPDGPTAGVPPKTPRARNSKKSDGRRNNGLRGTGYGWGGPAKGPGNGKGRVLKGSGPGRGHFSKTGEERAQRQARHAEEMRELYYEIAKNKENEPTVRLSAATHLLNRIEGLPVAKLVTANTDVSGLSDKELSDELDRQRAKVAAFENTAEEQDAAGNAQ